MYKYVWVHCPIFKRITSRENKCTKQLRKDYVSIHRCFQYILMDSISVCIEEGITCIKISKVQENITSNIGIELTGFKTIPLLKRYWLVFTILCVVTTIMYKSLPFNFVIYIECMFYSFIYQLNQPPWEVWRLDTCIVCS